MGESLLSSLGEKLTIRLVGQLNQLNKLSATVNRLKDVSSAPAVAGGDSIRVDLARAEVDLRRLNGALVEIEAGVRAFRDLQGRAVAHNDLAGVESLRLETEQLIAALTEVNRVTKSTGSSLFTQSE